jgi:hypothetical protein
MKPSTSKTITIDALASSLASRTMSEYADKMLNFIEICNSEEDLDSRIEILYNLNSSLYPPELQLNMPSLITDDYISLALYKLEMLCRQIKWIAGQSSISQGNSVSALTALFRTRKE